VVGDGVADPAEPDSKPAGGAGTADPLKLVTGAVTIPRRSPRILLLTSIPLT
jgi:hypothetical protein